MYEASKSSLNDYPRGGVGSINSLLKNTSSVCKYGTSISDIDRWSSLCRYVPGTDIEALSNFETLPSIHW